MKRIVFFVLAILLLPLAQGDDEEDQQELGYDEEDLLECFRCDLGFWDACYTTTVFCRAGERCFTGRGKAAGLLDVKTLGCAKAEECSGAEPSPELPQPNATLYAVSKQCCDTALCNAAAVPGAGAGAYLTAPALCLWLVAGASAAGSSH